MIRKKFFFWSVLSLFVLLVGSCSPASAEKTYTVTESQMNQLQAEFNLQKELLMKLKQNEQKQKEELILQRKELNESKQILQNQKALLNKSREALTNANQLLQKSEKETKAKIRKEKIQKGIWIGVSSVLLFALINRG